MLLVDNRILVFLWLQRIFLIVLKVDIRRFSGYYCICEGLLFFQIQKLVILLKSVKLCLQVCHSRFRLIYFLFLFSGGLSLLSFDF